MPRKDPITGVVVMTLPDMIGTWHMLTTSEIYRDLGGGNERHSKRLIAQLERFGHTASFTTADATPA